MSPEQFNQVVEAILAGKYSWACVLILRFAGYNPLHYIPYRTYNRLTKENCQNSKLINHKTASIEIANQLSEPKSDDNSSQRSLSKINDLEHLAVVGKQNAQVKGGKLDYCFTIGKYNLSKAELVPYRIQLLSAFKE
jgi:hypothetical protein